MTEVGGIANLQKINSLIREREKQPDGKSWEYYRKYAHKNKAEVRSIMKNSLLDKYRYKLEQRKKKKNN
jgi:hypothetical protein